MDWITCPNSTMPSDILFPIPCFLPHPPRHNNTACMLRRLHVCRAWHQARMELGTVSISSLRKTRGGIVRYACPVSMSWVQNLISSTSVSAGLKSHPVAWGLSALYIFHSTLSHSMRSVLCATGTWGSAEPSFTIMMIGRAPASM